MEGGREGREREGGRDGWEGGRGEREGGRGEGEIGDRVSTNNRTIYGNLTCAHYFLMCHIHTIYCTFLT